VDARAAAKLTLQCGIRVVRDADGARLQWPRHRRVRMLHNLHRPRGHPAVWVSWKRDMYTLYSMQRSGNSYKARLALAQLGMAYRLIEVDILKGESHTPEFLAKNPNGQVPLLEVAPGRYVAESNAILWFIAGSSSLMPEDRIGRAEALQWMFFEQHSLEPNLGAAYFWLTLIKGGRDLQSHAFEDWMEEGHRALGVMEKHLSRHDYFAAGHYTIADIALYAYTHVAHLCDFDLTAFPAVRAWLARVASQPGHVTMDFDPTAALPAL
jgi:glutathione S-transferase